MDLDKELTLVWQTIRALAAGVHRLGGIDETTHGIISASAYAGDRDVKAAEELAARSPLTPQETADLARLLERHYNAADAASQAPSAPPSGPAAFFSGQQPVQPAGAGLGPDDPNYAPRPVVSSPVVPEGS